MKHLIDGDIASNNGGWQWSASTGTDTAPYLNNESETQSLRFDEAGEYIRKYVKELRDCSNKDVHMPSNPKALGYVSQLLT